MSEFLIFLFMYTGSLVGTSRIHMMLVNILIQFFLTIWCTIPTLGCLIKNWEMLAAAPKFSLVKHRMVKGLEKLQKYTMATDQTDISLICLGISCVDLKLLTLVA